MQKLTGNLIQNSGCIWVWLNFFVGQQIVRLDDNDWNVKVKNNYYTTKTPISLKIHQREFKMNLPGLNWLPRLQMGSYDLILAHFFSISIWHYLHVLRVCVHAFTD